MPKKKRGQTLPHGTAKGAHAGRSLTFKVLNMYIGNLGWRPHSEAEP
jgi:hypothetical protein